MDYKTLMAKIAAQKAKQQIKKVEPKPAPVVEETPHEIKVEIKEEEILPVESEKVEVIIEEKPEEVAKPVAKKAPVKKPATKKPANRAYMVVEDIDEVNKEEVKEDIDF